MSVGGAVLAYSSSAILVVTYDFADQRAYDFLPIGETF